MVVVNVYAKARISTRARAQSLKLKYNALSINYPAPLRIVSCAEGEKVVN